MVAQTFVASKRVNLILRLNRPLPRDPPMGSPISPRPARLLYPRTRSGSPPSRVGHGHLRTPSRQLTRSFLI